MLAAGVKFDDEQEDQDGSQGVAPAGAGLEAALTPRRRVFPLTGRPDAKRGRGRAHRRNCYSSRQQRMHIRFRTVPFQVQVDEIVYYLAAP